MEGEIKSKPGHGTRGALARTVYDLNLNKWWWVVFVGHWTLVVLAFDSR
jgi:hypothetical protein